jgi:iron complex transport system ATP-binding protein
MLEIKNVTAGYPGRPVLQDISLTVPRGAVTVIAGPNGCGKSTLLKALAGILPAAGSVTLDGGELLTMSGRERARKVAFLPQNRQIPEITVKNLVLHGRFPYLSYPRRYRQQDREVARAAMERLGIAQLASEPLSTLSGGQRQRVYIAMALAQETEYILLDEPTTYLDMGSGFALMDILKELAEGGKGIVAVLHDLPLALEYAHRFNLIQTSGSDCHTPAQIGNGGILCETLPETEVELIALLRSGNYTLI